jgi:hypothetical protein
MYLLPELLQRNSEAQKRQISPTMKQVTKKITAHHAAGTPYAVPACDCPPAACHCNWQFTITLPESKVQQPHSWCQLNVCSFKKGAVGWQHGTAVKLTSDASQQPLPRAAANKIHKASKLVQTRVYLKHSTSQETTHRAAGALCAVRACGSPPGGAHEAQRHHHHCCCNEANTQDNTAAAAAAAVFVRLHGSTWHNVMVIATAAAGRKQQGKQQQQQQQQRSGRQSKACTSTVAFARTCKVTPVLITPGDTDKPNTPWPGACCLDAYTVPHCASQHQIPAPRRIVIHSRCAHSNRHATLVFAHL